MAAPANGWPFDVSANASADTSLSPRGRRDISRALAPRLLLFWTRMIRRVIPGSLGAAPRKSGPIQIVATPGSGNGRALHTALQLREALRASGREARLRIFDGLAGLRRWATTAGSGYFSLLICIGGDGTQSATAEAALRRSVPFLPVPSGFGNLFGRALGHAHGSDRVADRVMELLECGDTVPVDAGVRNGQLFLCHESFGLLSEIQHRAEASFAWPRARWRRAVAYYRAAVRHLRETPLTPLRVAVDGRVVARDAVIVTVANVETYDPWLRLTPGASPVDGLFDVFLMRETTKRVILASLLGRHLRITGPGPGTLLCRGRRVAIVAPRGARDELELMPGVLPVVVSPETAEALKGNLGRGDDLAPARRGVA